MSDTPMTKRLVVEALEHEAPLTPTEIGEQVDRSARSIRTALRQLEREDHVWWQADVEDPRRRLYALTETDSPGERRRAHNASLGEGER
jgi:DNA-binding MarR family transcriptional regulator